MSERAVILPTFPNPVSPSTKIGLSSCGLKSWRMWDSSKLMHCLERNAKCVIMFLCSWSQNILKQAAISDLAKQRGGVARFNPLGS